jgi:hypothetical protein
MKRLCVLFIAVFAFLSLAGAMPTRAYQAIETVFSPNWTAKEGDFVVVDVAKNKGYLMRSDLSSAISFPVATGERRKRMFRDFVYFAGTPEQEWHVKSLSYLPRGATYGEHGKFLRLYDENGKTHYGIHTVYPEQEMFSMTDRYKSWGCIIVRDAMFSVLEEVFEVNEEDGMRVITIGEASEFPFHALSHIQTLA